MSTSAKTKIAILGGGVSAMTAAWYLSSTPGWQEKYDITVYQVGWRLGGKGASGRNQKIANRIEEHGFHFWWGFYDNAFRWIQACYEELNRPVGAPMATWQEAFKPVGCTVDLYCFGGRWTPLFNACPINEWTPGESPDKATTPAEYISQLLEHLHEGMLASEHAGLRVELPHTVSQFFSLSWWRSWLGEIETDLGEMTATALLSLACKLADQSDDNPEGLVSEIRYKLIEQLVSAFISGLWAAVKDKVLAEKDFDLYNQWVETDLACAIVRGMIRDDIISNGYDSINEWDYRAWLRERGGAQENPTLRSTTVRGIYDMVFAYENGATPNLEAGTALRTLLRMSLDTRGPFIWHMESGMGDTIFAPLYEVLERRGVRFEFFHRVEQLHLSDDQESIKAITVSRQVIIKEGKPYQPLIHVKGLPSWPAEPLYDQIVEGDKLKETIMVDGQEQPKYNLESFWTPWQNAETRYLEKGKDFDLVVLGISLGGLRWICRELLESPLPKWDKWRNMLKYVKTNQTQAFQLWLKSDVAGLGQAYWRGGQTIVNGYDVERDCSPDTGGKGDCVDSWADLSHVIKRESWPDDHYPYNITYFASSMRGPALEELPPPDHHDFPYTQFRQCKANSLHFLHYHLQPVWPRATKADGRYPACLNWDLLVDMQERQGEDRFNSQFWRVNVDPSERYVLSVPGSSKYRLKTDESGCDNLYLTGDWIWNGANAGFVESAVISGILTSQAVTGRLLGRCVPEKIICWPDAPQP